MKFFKFAIAAFLAVFVSGGAFASSVHFKGYGFSAFVQKSGGSQYREYRENGHTWLKVGHNEEYSIVVKNPLPVRVAVAVSIDGLNTIDGKRTSLKDASKWIIEPYSSITVSGWQTSMKTLRKFVFTEQPDAYAQWKENKEGKKYTKNLGVIGVAWSWNSSELETALNPPQPFAEDRLSASEAKKDRSASGASNEPKAGTGMGTQQQHHVYEVEFNGDAGMFSVRDVLKIYYEFAKETPRPSPFEEDGGEISFAQDMYK